MPAKAKKKDKQKPCDMAGEIARLGAAVEALQQQYRDEAMQFDGLARKMSDLEIAHARLEGTVNQRSQVVNCPHCHRLFTGSGAVGKRRCGVCSGVF